MVTVFDLSLVINRLTGSPWRETYYTADVRWQPPARETRHPAQADSDEPDVSRADAQAVGRRSGIGAEYEAGPGLRTEPAEGRQGSRRARGDVACGCSRSGSLGLGCEDGTTIFEWIR